MMPSVRHFPHASVSNVQQYMNLSGTGQFDQLPRRLGHNTLQNVPLQGAEENSRWPSLALNPANSETRRLGKAMSGLQQLLDRRVVEREVVPEHPRGYSRGQPRLLPSLLPVDP